MATEQRKKDNAIIGKSDRDYLAGANTPTPVNPKPTPGGMGSSPPNPLPGTAPGPAPLVQAGQAIRRTAGQAVENIGTAYRGAQNMATALGDTALNLSVVPAANAAMQVTAGIAGADSAPQLPTNLIQRSRSALSRAVAGAPAPTPGANPAVQPPAISEGAGVDTGPARTPPKPGKPGSAPPAPAVDVRANPPKDSFVGSDGQVRQIGADGALTGTGAGSVTGTPGGVTYVGKEAFTPPPRTLAQDQYDAQVAEAQAGRQALRDRIARGTIAPPNPGDFRPGQSTGLTRGERANLADTEKVNQRLDAATLAGRQQQATAGLAEANNAAELAQQEAANAGALAQEQARTRGQLRIERSRQAVPQLVTGGDGSIYRAGTEGPATPLTTADGTPLKAATEDKRAAARAKLVADTYPEILATLTPVTGFQDDAQRQAAEVAAKRQVDAILVQAGFDAPAQDAPAATPPQGAIDLLKKNPSAAADFDAKYGPGAAAKYLGG